MKTLPRTFLFPLVMLAAAGCVDVGTTPGVSPDGPEPDAVVEPCDASQTRMYRCSQLPSEEVQICKETSTGEFVWDTIDFCGDGEGCLENPLNDYPMCSPKYACFDVVQNLVSCDSAPNLQASDRNDCRSAVQRLAIDDSYRDLYDCYYGNRCETSDDVFACVLTACPDILAVCYHGDPSRDEGTAEAVTGTSMPAPSGEGDGSKEREESGTPAVDERPDGEPSGGSENDPRTPGSDDRPDELAPDPALLNPVCVDVWSCAANCGQECALSCGQGAAGALSEYERIICEQTCFPECKQSCCDGTSYEDMMSFLAGVNCIESSCSDVDAGEVQQCLWQSCPEVYSHCLVAGEGAAECKDTFGCLLDATESDLDTLTNCSANATSEVFSDAMTLMTCVGEVTLPNAACEWIEGSWAEHVQANAACIVEACAAEAEACPLPYAL